jgi:hypothetical protein
MSSLALHLHRNIELRPAPVRAPRNAPVRARRGILHRLLGRISAAIARSHERRAEQDAGRFIAEHGGRLTDDIERQLGEHFVGRRFPPYGPPRSFGPFL